MITNQTLDRLLLDNNIKIINDECADIGLSNVRLFITPDVEDKDKIHFLGSSDTGISLFLLQQIESRIAELLQCDVIVRAEHMLDELVKNQIISNVATYNSTNKVNITKFFNEQIFPLAMNTSQIVAYEETSKTEHLPEKILEQIQKDPRLWEQVKQNPSVLMQACSIVQAQHRTGMEVK